MKIQHIDEGNFARIWITGPFWQLAKARKLADVGYDSAPVHGWESKGLTFQLTLYGANKHILRAFKAIAADMRRKA